MSQDDLVESIVTCGIPIPTLIEIIEREKQKKELLLTYKDKVSMRLYNVLCNNYNNWELYLSSSSIIEVSIQDWSIDLISPILGEKLVINNKVYYNTPDANKILDELIYIDTLVISPNLSLNIEGICMGE